jgi:hypothetical protein
MLAAAAATAAVAEASCTHGRVAVIVLPSGFIVHIHGSEARPGTCAYE